MASRFWVTQPVSGAIVSASSPPQVRLTVSSTTGMTTGDVRTVAGIVGTTEANGTWTITVIDATHIDLQGTTFTNVYTSGGFVEGKWDTTNANNWVSSSGGTNYGQTVPTSADTVTFDGSSGSGTAIVNHGTLSVSSLTCGAYTGTLDFSVNNNNIAIGASGFNGSGNAARTIKGGTGTWTITATSANPWVMTTITGLTNPTTAFASCTIVLTGNTTTSRSFTGGTLTYGTVTINTNTSGGITTIASINTITTLNLNGQNYIAFSAAQTITTLTPTGTSSAILTMKSNADGTAIVITYTNAITGVWTGVRDITFTSASNATFSNSFDLGKNTISGGGALSITAPGGGGGQRVIGAG